MEKAICIRLEADAKQIMNCREVVQELDNSFDELSNILSLTGNPVRLKILYLLIRHFLKSYKLGRYCLTDY